jgi:hypothetical protein
MMGTSVNSTILYKHAYCLFTLSDGFNIEVTGLLAWFA